MLRAMTGVSLVVVAACAAEPDGLLVVTDKPIGGGDVTVDVFVGIDRDLPFAPLTETRPFLLEALPDDRDVPWRDPTRPFTVMLDVHTDDELYVVLRGRDAAGGGRFEANLRAPVVYPGSGYYSVTAELFTPGAGGACPHGFADDAGYHVELVGAVDPNQSFDCDLDASPYPQDCADYDAAIHPAPDYPPSSGIVTPPELMCCNGDDRVAMQIEATNSGPGSCNLSFGCPGADPVFGPRSVRWSMGPGVGVDGDFCACVGDDRHPLDCLAAARAFTTGDPATPVLAPYCTLAVEEDGAVCPDQVAPIRDRFRDFLPQTPVECPVSIVWQAGAVAIGLRGQGETEVTLSTHDCDADVVFTQAGPPAGQVAEDGAFGWYIVDVMGVLVPMHVHPAAADRVGCQEPTFCDFE